MLRIFCILLLLLIPPALTATPSWNAKKFQTKLAKAKTKANITFLPKLKPGQFIWRADAVKGGGMWARVSLPEQKLYLYRKGVLIGVSTVSTGTRDHQTPVGNFKVRGKTWLYRSKKYDNALMPYTHWLTSKGVAMHAGRVSGYPNSHGCIRLPNQFARLLYANSPIGMPVIITQQLNKVVTVQPYNKRKLPPLPILETRLDDELAVLTY